MRRRALASAFVMLAVAGCWSTEPDYVASTVGTQCDVRSRLVRRGYPENLDAVLAGECTVTRMDPMRGPDFGVWLANRSTAITTCDSPVRIPFWTEKSPEGKIIRVHFCPAFCQELHDNLVWQIQQDTVCNDAGVPAAPLPPDPAIMPPNAAQFVPQPAAGASGAAPLAGAGGAAGF